MFGYTPRMYSMLPKNGDIISDRYRIGDLIGRGSMGVVYDADDLTTGHEVALKLLVLRDHSSKMVNRFFRGARLAQKFEHPHVVRTLGFGYRSEHSRDPYLVMDRVHGFNLTQLIGSSLSHGSGIGLMMQSLSALAHMHARGILHRDLKPDNLLVERRIDGALSIRITDFGLAAAIGDEENNSLITGENIVVGTAAYMAPEQAVASTLASPTSDLYAIGTILYEIINGKRPFTGTPLSVILSKTLHEPPRLGDTTTIPNGLNDAIMKMLAREPGDRFLTAADALTALDPYAEAPCLAELPQALEHSSLAQTVDTDGSGYVYLIGDESREYQSVQFDNPLWGREDILERISQLAHQAEAGLGCTILLESHIGMEATAIVDHVAIDLAEGGRFTILRGAFQEVAGAEGGLRQALEGYWRTHGLPEEILVATIVAHLARHNVTSSSEQEVLVRFLRPGQNELPHSDLKQNELFAIFFRTLRRLAVEKPVCLVLDELHRGGPLAAAFLEYALFELSYSPFPLLILPTSATHRADDALTETLRNNQGYRERVIFHVGIPAIAETDLADALRNQAGLTLSMANHVARISGGSPIVARHLAEVYRLADNDSSLTASVDLAPALTNVLMRSVDARINVHPHGESLRMILNALAILGAAVEYELLRAMVSDDIANDHFDQYLGSLLDLDIVTTTAYDNEELFFLSPSSLRDLVLQQQPRPISASLHGRAIEARLSLAGERLNRVDGPIGDHYAAMGNHDKALEYWLQASAFETSQGDPLEGARWGAKALVDLDIDDPRGVVCALQVGQTLLDVGHLDKAAELLAPYIARAGANSAMVVGEVLADVYENRGDSTEWTKLVDSLGEKIDGAEEVGLRAFLRTRAMWQNSYGRSRAGLADAIQALKMAPPGPEAQRAAQRAVYCCLALNTAADGEPYARTALEEAGEDPALRVRSLRALGTVLTWLHRATESIALHAEALELCQRAGLHARIAIAYHDLGDAYRMAGQGAKAEEAYAMALHCADELSMGHTRELVRVKQVMSALTDGRTEGVVRRLQRLAPEALASGLGLAVPFCALLEAWAHAQCGERALAQAALETAGDIANISVDPQVPSIVDYIEGQLG